MGKTGVKPPLENLRFYLNRLRTFSVLPAAAAATATTAAGEPAPT